MLIIECIELCETLVQSLHFLQVSRLPLSNGFVLKLLSLSATEWAIVMNAHAYVHVEDE